MRLTKYKRLRRKLARRHIRSRELTDTKPLQTGGRFHVHMGRVHRGAGFEGEAPTAGEQIRDVVSMTPIGAVVRGITDAIIPVDNRKAKLAYKGEEGLARYRAQMLKKQGGVLTRKQEKYMLEHPDDTKYYNLAINQVKRRIAKKKSRR